MTSVPLDAGPYASHAHLFERAFFVNADDSPRRRDFMEQQLRKAGVRYERWPALRGSPALLRSHSRYFSRGIERHLYANRSATSGTIVQWGTIGTYLTHLLLFESIVRRWGHNESASFLILQDDTQLARRWVVSCRRVVTATRRQTNSCSTPYRSPRS